VLPDTRQISSIAGDNSQPISHTSVLVHFSMTIYIESANNTKPTMTATVAMGDNPTPIKYMKTIQPTLLFTKEVKCLNKINCHKKTASCMYHHIGKNVEKPMATAITTNHHEHQPLVNSDTTHKTQQELLDILWKEMEASRVFFQDTLTQLDTTIDNNSTSLPKLLTSGNTTMNTAPMMSICQWSAAWLLTR